MKRIFIIYLFNLLGSIKAMEPQRAAPTIIEEYEPGGPVPVTKMSHEGLRLIEEYIPEQSYFENLPRDLILLIASSSRTIEDAAEKLRQAFKSSPTMKGHSHDLAYNEPIIKLLAERFYPSNEQGSVLAAIALNTDGAKEFLKKQTDVLSDAIKQLSDKELTAAELAYYVGIASAIVKSGANVNVRDKENYTPLALFLQSSRKNASLPPDLSELLLDKGALVTIKGLPGFQTIPQLAGSASYNQATTMQNFSMKRKKAFEKLEQRIKEKQLEELRNR